MGRPQAKETRIAMTGKTDRKQETPARRGRPASVFMSLKFSLDQNTQRNLLLLLVSLLIAFIVIPKGNFIPGFYQPGDIAQRNVKAPRDLLVPDEVLTEKKQREAADAVLPLYDYDPRAGHDITERLKQSFMILDKAPAPETVRRKELEALLGIGLSDAELAVFRRVASRPEQASLLVQSLRDVMQNQIVGNLKLFQTGGEHGIVMRNLVTRQEQIARGLDQVIGIGDAIDIVGEQLRDIQPLNNGDRAALMAQVGKLLRPNLTYNQSETESRRQAGRDAVKPVLMQVKKGEMIVREGERVTGEQLAKLKAFRELGSDHLSLRMAAGLFLMMLLLLSVAHRYGRRNISKYRVDNRDLTFMAVTFAGLFILVKLSIFICSALEGSFPYIESSSYYYAFPFAVGAMLVRIVLNSEVALLFGLVFSMVVGLLFGDNLHMALFALVGSFTGGHWVRHCIQRTTLYQAGWQLSLVNVSTVLATQLIAGRGFDTQMFYKAGFGFAGGFICALLVTGLVPLVEALFKYTTNIKLLELANMNTPLLRELMIQAPGTYHHSIIVGNLAEAAAETIGANPLMARVAAYYHDIGKIRKPLYFVENIGTQENRHNKLSPSMSALILMFHVKEGADMARENKLGQTLIDIIRQHHGTALIKFFYDKAKNLEDPGVQQVNERDYRYPGPKPQTREAALIMLADAIEAASRTLTDPTPARIQGMVQKIINNIFIDGQLDECELTLKDLHNIAKSFNRILAGIFHHRIDYPEPVHKEREKETVKKKNGDDSHREPPKESKDSAGNAAKGSSEDLKRLGMS
jgi:putative nucleotidyltransferase with HDIG domain